MMTPAYLCILHFKLAVWRENTIAHFLRSFLVKIAGLAGAVQHG
jgi:hypothetical protein